MEIRGTRIPGCLILTPKVFTDERGVLVKPFNVDSFRELNIGHSFDEDYYSISKKGVLRGLHFQIPPVAQAKLAHCVKGRVIDVVVDLRAGSPAYGEYEMFELDERNPSMVYIPEGLAHGFFVLSAEALMLYKTSTVHYREYDQGIHWQSLGIPWPEKRPLLSERDRNLPDFKDFNSPFIYSPAGGG